MADIEIVKVGLKYHRDSHKEGCVQGSQACPYIAKGDRCFHILLDEALSVINEQQAEIDRLKAEKDKAIKNIDLYIADAEADAKIPLRVGKGYSVGLGYGLLMAKEILEGTRCHG